MASGVWTAICFFVGMFVSWISGGIGLLSSANAGQLTCKACTKSLSQGLNISLKVGIASTLNLQGFSLLSLSILFIIFVSSVSNSNIQKSNYEYNYIVSSI